MSRVTDIGKLEKTTSMPDRYTALLEEGVDPYEAHRATFGSDKEAVEPDPAGRFAALLEEGHAPDKAYEAAFLHEKDLYTAGPPPARPVPLADAAFSQAPPTTPVNLLKSLHAYATQEFSETGAGGLYTSYVYKVVYNKTAPDDVTLAWMRIQIPAFDPTDMEYIPIVLALPGGNDVVAAVMPEEADETLIDQRKPLALGTSWSDTGPFYRDGPPMVTILPTYPGRGADWTDGGGPDLTATGDPDFLDMQTPDNETGMDYMGDLTSDAIEAIVQVAFFLLRDIQANSKGDDAFETLPLRLVVLSYSDGISAAARWIGDTGLHVHALVDFEGPADSVDRAMVTAAYDPFELGDGSLPTELTCDVWSDWAVEVPVGHNISYWFRPPSYILDEDDWPDDEDKTVGILDALEDGLPDYANAWRMWYAPGAWDRDVFIEDMTDFWTYREATTLLPNLAARKCAYVRIQESEDHAQPYWVAGWNAVKAIGAAFRDGANPNVFYADNTFWTALNDTEDSTLAPIRCTIKNWTGRVDITDPSTWPAWIDRGAISNDIIAWTSHVDLVRWAMDQEFRWI